MVVALLNDRLIDMAQVYMADAAVDETCIILKAQSKAQNVFLTTFDVNLNGHCRTVYASVLKEVNASAARFYWHDEGGNLLNGPTMHVHPEPTARALDARYSCEVASSYRRRLSTTTHAVLRLGAPSTWQGSGCKS